MRSFSFNGQPTKGKYCSLSHSAQTQSWSFHGAVYHHSTMLILSSLGTGHWTGLNNDIPITRAGELLGDLPHSYVTRTSSPVDEKRTKSEKPGPAEVQVSSNASSKLEQKAERSGSLSIIDKQNSKECTTSPVNEQGETSESSGPGEIQASVDGLNQKQPGDPDGRAEDRAVSYGSDIPQGAKIEEQGGLETRKD